MDVSSSALDSSVGHLGHLGHAIADYPTSPTIPASTLTQPEPTILSNDTQVCWLEVRSSPYQPNHYAELLHLQAEADALLVKLQTRQQERQKNTLSCDAVR